MKILASILVSILFVGHAYADDPGIRDTVMVGSVHVELSEPYVDVPIFVVSDDSVVFYNMPISWSMDAEGIAPSEVIYYYPLTYWDELYDSVLVDEHYIRMLGWEDGPFYLNTGGQKRRVWEIRFTIDSLAPPQVVTIDTTQDSINGSTIFGLVGGLEWFEPVVLRGAIYYGVQSDAGDLDQMFPSRLSLNQNYPNPFNASTTIEFKLPEEAEIEISVYNILGQKVAVLFEGTKAVGTHSVTWDAGDVPSGVYFARLEGGGETRAAKMLLLK